MNAPLQGGGVTAWSYIGKLVGVPGKSPALTPDTSADLAQSDESEDSGHRDSCLPGNIFAHRKGDGSSTDKSGDSPSNNPKPSPNLPGFFYSHPYRFVNNNPYATIDILGLETLGLDPDPMQYDQSVGMDPDFNFVSQPQYQSINGDFSGLLAGAFLYTQNPSAEFMYQLADDTKQSLNWGQSFALAYNDPVGHSDPLPAMSPDDEAQFINGMLLGASFVDPTVEGLAGGLEIGGLSSRIEENEEDSLGNRATAMYQQFYNEAWQKTVQAFVAGDINISTGQKLMTVLGQRTDAAVRMAMNNWVSAEGLSDQVIINRRLYDPLGSGRYGIPDVYVPSENLILEGTIGTKTMNTPQIQNFLNWTGGRVQIINPTIVPQP
jgi:hypothetical protein